MKSCMPEAYKELVENCEILEKHYKDMMVIVIIPIYDFPISVTYTYFNFWEHIVLGFIFYP